MMNMTRIAAAIAVAAFAAFDEDFVTFSPDEGRVAAVNPGVSRTFCGNCGSPLTGRYDYLPGQVYIAVGVIDQAADLRTRVCLSRGQSSRSPSRARLAGVRGCSGAHRERRSRAIGGRGGPFAIRTTRRLRDYGEKQ